MTLLARGRSSAWGFPLFRSHAEATDVTGCRHFDVVLDTDTYNEVDDQFALAYALLSPERLRVEACYAAPFHNHRSADAADGMERSYHEIHRVLSFLPGQFKGPVCRGATSFLSGAAAVRRSEVTDDLIARAMQERSAPLYVIAIAALTNIATALRLEPRIRDRIVVVWLGGQPREWYTAHEFNLRQDPIATRTVLDCGVPLIRIPCKRVAEALVITPGELGARMAGALGGYFVQTVRDYLNVIGAQDKVIWDISGPALLINPAWVPTTLQTSPVLTPAMTWRHDPDRHFIREATAVDRESIFDDMFAKFGAHAKSLSLCL